MEKRLNILDLANPIFVPVEDARKDASGQTVSYTQGYGQLAKAGATVQQGVKGSIDVNLEIDSLKAEFYTETTKEVINSVTEEVKSELQEYSKEKNYKKWWFAFLAGASDSGHDSNYYEKQTSCNVTTADTKYINAATSKMSSYKQSYSVTGHFEIEGKSEIATTVYLFIEMLTVRTEDGTTILVPTNNVAVADKDGNTGCADAKGHININQNTDPS